MAQLEPCACQREPLGGLARHVSEIARRVADDPVATLVLDSGDALSAATVVTPSELANATANAKSIVRHWEKVGVFATTLGERDLSLGPAVVERLLAAAPTIVVATNLSSNAGEITKWSRRRVGDTEVLVLGLIDHDSLSGSARDLGWRAEPPGPAMRRALEAQDAPPDLVIVLSQLGMRQQRRLADRFAVPILFLGGRFASSSTSTVEVGPGLGASAGQRGQYLGVLDLELRRGKPIRDRDRPSALERQRAEARTRADSLSQLLARGDTETSAETIREARAAALAEARSAELELAELANTTASSWARFELVPLDDTVPSEPASVPKIEKCKADLSGSLLGD